MGWGMFGIQRKGLSMPHRAIVQMTCENTSVPSIVLTPNKSPGDKKTVVGLWHCLGERGFQMGLHPCLRHTLGRPTTFPQGRLGKHLETPVSRIFPFLPTPNSQGEMHKHSNLPLDHWVPFQGTTQKSFHIWLWPKPTHWNRILLLNKSQTCSISEIKRTFWTKMALIIKGWHPDRKMLCVVLLKIQARPGASRVD